jgi:hypothetical protein
MAMRQARRYSIGGRAIQAGYEAARAALPRIMAKAG